MRPSQRAAGSVPQRGSAGRIRVGFAVASILLGTGCSGSQVVAPAPQPVTSDPAISPAAAGNPDVVRARQQAQIADCPAVDPAAQPVPGGLPDLRISCLGGDSEVRLAGLRGPMLVNLWAQWCGPCRQESPYLKEFSERAGAAGVRVIGVDFADPQPELAVEFAHQAGWKYPQLADPQRRLGVELQVVGPPQTFFIDAQGKIVHRHVGPFTSTDQLQALVQERLGVRV